MKIEINNAEKEGIKKVTSGLKETKARKRAFASLLGLSSVVNFLKKSNLKVENDSLCADLSILEEFEIADIRVEDIRIDVRAIIHENPDLIWISKKNFKYGLLPDIYVVTRVMNDFSGAEILGFINSKDVNTSTGNEKYYFVDSTSLRPVSELVEAIKTATPFNMEFSDEEHEKSKKLYLSYIEKNISNEDKKILLAHLFVCKPCRDEFCKMSAFEARYSGFLNTEKAKKVFSEDEDFTLKIFAGDILVKEEVLIPLEEPEFSISNIELLESDEVFNELSEENENIEELDISIEEKAILNNEVSIEDVSEGIKEDKFDLMALSERDKNPEISEEQNGGLFKKIADKIRDNNTSEEEDNVAKLLADIDEVEVVSSLDMQEEVHEQSVNDKDEKFDENNLDDEPIFEIPAAGNSGMLKVAAVIGILIIAGTVSFVTFRSHNQVSKAPVSIPATSQVASSAVSVAGEPARLQKLDNNEQLPVQAIAKTEELVTKIKSVSKKQEIPPSNVIKPVKRNLNDVLANAFIQGAGITITNISWEVGVSLVSDNVFKNYLMVTGQALKMALSRNLLVATDKAVNDRIKIKLVLDLEGNIKDSVIAESSGSKQVDDIVLQTIKETFDYTKLPKIKTKKDSITANVIINL